MTRATKAAALESIWKIDTIPAFSGGLNTSSPDYLIMDEEVCSSLNVSYRGDRIRVDAGYVEIGVNTTLRGIPSGAYQHEDASGSAELILVTYDTVYKYVPAKDAWHYISDGNSTTLSVGEASGQTNIDVADTTGFSVNDYIAIEMDDATEHHTTIASITPGAPGVLVVDDATPSAAAATNYVVKAVDLSGSSTYQTVFAAVPSNEWTVFTNGVDKPMRYDGSTVEVIPNLPSGGSLVCRTLAVYKAGYLLLGNLIEGGVSKPYKLVWCDAGDPTNWTTGDAGYANLMDVRDNIVGIKPLGDYIIIYRSRSIVRAEFLGMPTATFYWRTTVPGRSATSQGLGLLSPNSVFILSDMHVFAGRSGIYSYDGAYGIKELSKKVFETVFSNNGAMDGSKTHRTFMAYNDKDGELSFFYPAVGETYCKNTVVFNIREDTWYQRKYQREFVFAADEQRASMTEPRISDLSGTIAAQSWVIGGAAAMGDSPAMITGASDGVFEHDFISPTEAGTAISWGLRTKRWRSMERYVRHNWVEVDYKGGPIAFLRIKDNGRLAPITTLPLVGTLTRIRIYHDICDKSIQYLFLAAAGGCEIGALSFKYKEASRWEL